MELQLEPPPPLDGGGEGGGEARWGGEYLYPPGPALCPLANVVLPPQEAREEARSAGALNARLGRPTRGGVWQQTALRCVATRALPAGTVILAEMAEAAQAAGAAGAEGAAGAVTAAAAGAAPGDYVRVSVGALSGRTGEVERLREDGAALVRLGGRLVVLPQEKLAVIDPPPAEPSVEAPPPRKRPTRAL